MAWSDSVFRALAELAGFEALDRICREFGSPPYNICDLLKVKKLVF